MEEKSFLFTDKLTKRMLQLRFRNDKLFKSQTRPWLDFYNILLKDGFPPEMTLEQVRKKWSYTWDMYKLAKKEKNKHWKYYKLFEKHYGKTQVLDKYESWSNKWRLKLIICISEAKERNLDHQTLWRSVERAMRCQDLPEDCCIQDMQGLWHHLKMTFRRKHRIKLKRPAQPSDWPLYETMLEYYGMFEPEQLINMQAEKHSYIVIPKQKANANDTKQGVDNNENEHEFQWSKDITESFIQVRLQNDWLFSQRVQPWKDFVTILRQEHGFPDTLTFREAGRKWACTYAEYQKAKATNNKSWLYHDLFELYLGEGTTSINPLLEWEVIWALNLIQARTSLEDFFVANAKLDPSKCWREVEKRLRSNGIPLDHSLLDLPNIWSYLLKTYKWKRKFADKGVLKEQWPYFESMSKYMEIQVKFPKRQKQRQIKQETADYEDTANNDSEDDLKLFDLKQKMGEVKPKYDVANQCRACANVDACIDIFAHKDEDGLDAASKLKIIGGIEVDKSENIPSRICFICLRELDNAYKFRRRCQTVDKHFRDSAKIVKTEVDDLDKTHDDDDFNCDMNDTDAADDITVDYDAVLDKTHAKSRKKVLKKVIIQRRRRKYEYWKICEICGLHTKNLKSHVDSHNIEKPYSCNVCDKKFKFKNGLFIHKAAHAATPKKTCEICGKTFHIMAHYRRHFVHHANERKFACDTCGKRFNSVDILKVHTRIHTDERPFSCSECGKTFRTAGCVSRHKRIVHRITKKVQ